MLLVNTFLASVTLARPPLKERCVGSHVSSQAHDGPATHYGHAPYSTNWAGLQIIYISPFPLATKAHFLIGHDLFPGDRHVRDCHLHRTTVLTGSDCQSASAWVGTNSYNDCSDAILRTGVDFTIV
ncbi:uncharacterized protein EI90DRAFT_2966349 [Cantharellus anzutake]|uniref:uncharacterized protein n=1 Tax=Cantharellus anzutake TaxID=1750568 RepID=UPI001908611B|nr:uncharacterized protein EI90DRAFT_2966349 [Cantharellus anzutake]KAF8340503.1 hypothetical protein EI90DRAFT_2966349 [Cantharellus anzutake]